MKPETTMVLSPKNVSANVDGNSVSYTDVKWGRNNFSKYLLGSLVVGTVFHRTLKMSRWWVVGAFVPSMLLCYMDTKFVPYGEIESFYTFVNEKRKSEANYKMNASQIEKELIAYDSE